MFRDTVAHVELVCEGSGFLDLYIPEQQQDPNANPNYCTAAAPPPPQLKPLLLPLLLLLMPLTSKPCCSLMSRLCNQHEVDASVRLMQLEHSEVGATVQRVSSLSLSPPSLPLSLST